MEKEERTCDDAEKPCHMPVGEMGLRLWPSGQTLLLHAYGTLVYGEKIAFFADSNGGHKQPFNINSFWVKGRRGVNLSLP